MHGGPRYAAHRLVCPTDRRVHRWRFGSLRRAAIVTGLPHLGPCDADSGAAYAGNCWWFGKWHLSACTTTSPLLPYGFNTRTYPGGPAVNPSPNGWPNEGSNGGEFTGSGPFNGYTFASDSLIAGDFVGWLGGQIPPAAKPTQPWCATVSMINPHDITKAPAWLQSNPFPPTGVPPQAVYFPPPPFPPASGAPALYTKIPSPWNYENLKVVLNKPSLQYFLQKDQNIGDDQVANWATFLNQYYWLQNYVDQQVGAVLTALQSSKYHNNTIVIFAADHGEFGGSHGLHDKGDAIYEESIHVPLYVHFPNQTSMIPMDQMCSSVDFFGLMCDLATSGAGTWPQAYPDLAHRQSIWSFLYQNAAETRIAPTLGIPYIFHTCDDDTNTPAATKFHIVGFRTKADPLNTSQPGGKLGIYSEWGNCSFVPDSTPPDYEFYDYNPATTNNWQELGNDYFSSNPATHAAIGDYLAELGSWGPPQSGLISSELNPPLTGTGTDGNPLSDAQAAAQQNYLNYVYGTGACTE